MLMCLKAALVRFNLLPVWRREVHVWGKRLLAVSFDRWLNLQLHRLGMMGREEAAFLRAVIRPGMNVVDVGANQGLYTLLLSEIVGESGSVVAFEPDPELFAVLSLNCRANFARNVQLHNSAVGSTGGHATLSRSLLNAGDNRLSSGQSRMAARNVSVKMVTVDEIIGSRPVDFIKIDVQGWEGEALKGMERMLSANPLLKIYFEYWPYGLTKAGYSPAALLDYLGTRGFSIYECKGLQPRLIGDLAGFAKLHGRRYTNLYAERGCGTLEPSASAHAS